MISDLTTPFAVVDAGKAEANIAPLRLHVKTAKSVEVARMAFGGRPGPITVSTLAEAEAFADAGFTDILYAVGITPDKLNRVIALRQRGVDLVVLLDSVAQAAAVAEACTDGNSGGTPHTRRHHRLRQLGHRAAGPSRRRGTARCCGSHR